MNEEHYSQHHVHVRKLVVLLLVLLAVSMMFLSYRERVRKQAPLPIQKPHSMTRTNGSMRLELAENRHVYALGEPVEVIVYGDSHGETITGVDAVIKVLPSESKVVSFESLYAGMDIKVNQAADGIYVTGVPTLDSTSSAPETLQLKNEPLFSVIIKPFVTKPLSFQLAFSPDQTDDSNIVVQGGTDILAKVEGVTAYFGDEKDVVMGTTTPITASISMTIQPAATPSPDCADCLSSYPVLVSTKGVSSSQVFEFGGITGSRTSVFETTDGIFEATLISPTRLKVRFAPHVN